MKPNKPGEWHSRSGRKIVAFPKYGGDLLYRNMDNGRGSYMEYLSDNDWLPAEPPKFPELPPKPGLVLFTQSHWAPENTYWGTIKDGILYVVAPVSGHCATYNLLYAKIVVIPHPDNDPEMVTVIEESQ